MIQSKNVMNNENYVEDILQLVHDITIEEFKLGGYEYVEQDEEKKKSTKRDNIEFNIMSGKMKKAAYDRVKKQEASGKTVEQVKTVFEDEEKNMDILSDIGIFNIVKDKSKLIAWKKIEPEDKKNKVTDFIKSNYENFPEVLFNKVLDLVDSGKINYKKYIVYDPIVCRILEMPVIKHDKIKDIYKLNYSDEKKSKKKKISFK